MSGLIQITLEKGVIATPENHKKTVKALGLNHRHQSRIVKDTPAVRGMVNHVGYLLKVENVSSAEKKVSNPFAAKAEYVLGAVKEKKTKAPKAEKNEEVSASEKKAKGSAKTTGAKKAKAESKEGKVTKTAKATKVKK